MNWKLCATVVATAAALVSCTAGGVQSAPSSSPSTSVTTTTAPTTTTTSTPPPFYSHIYESNFDRQVAISAVTREFGLLVMQEAKKKGRSAWGVFDTYCSRKGQDGGFVSRGYVPAVGDECTTQHTPDYSLPSIQISATYEVLPGNQQNFVRADVSTTPDCRVQTEHSLRGGVRIASTTKTIRGQVSTDMKFESTSNAKTEAEARTIDQQVIACIQATRP